MKILMSVFTRRYEGTFYRAFPWAAFLASRGHDVTIICTSDKHLFHTVTSMDQGVRIIESPAFMTGGKLMNRLAAMTSWGPLDIAARYKELRYGHYDMVHVFEHHLHVALPVYLAGRKRIPVLIADWCDHYGKGGFRESYVNSRYYHLYRLLGRPVQMLLDYIESDLRQRADAVTVISTYLRQRAINCGVTAEKIYLIPGSADTTLISPAPHRPARSRLGLDEDRPYALFFGAGQFDLDFCLEAFSLVLQQMPDARCIIVGKKDAAVTRKSGELGIQSSVIQTGWIADDQLSNWLACADVCLLPMKDTPINHARWPNKIGFYMAASRPTVATGVNDIGELIETGDIGLVSRVDPQDFADNVLYLFTHRQLALEMGQRARCVAEKEYASSIQGEQLEQLYLNSSGARHD